MKKRVISIILIIAVSIPMFKVNTVKSSAVDPTVITDLLRAIGLVTAGAVAGGAAMGLGDCLAEVIDGGLDTWYNETLPNKVTTSANNALNGNGIGVVNTSSGYYVTVNDTLSGDDLEYATILADKLNSEPMLDTIITGISEVTTGLTGMGLNKASYEQLKSIIGQATSEFTQKKAIEHAKEAGMTLIDNGALPAYNFNFVGPMQPGLELPTLATTADTFLLDGFTLTKPFVLNESNSSWWNGMYQPKKENYSSLGLKSYNGLVGYQIPGGTWGGIYVIYNDTIFSFSDYDISENPRAYGCGIANMLHGLRSPDGKYLKDFFATASEVEKACLPRGFFYTTSPYTAYITNVSSSTVDTDDFTTSIPVGPIQIPRTEGEQVVTDGINLGLISDNPELVLDEDGNIVKIDGIDTAKLMELLQTISNNGSISFDSIEQYLQAITAMLSASNADAKTLNTVITNLNELTKAQNKSIEEINTNVAAIAKAFAISDTTTADNTFDIDTPSTIIDKFPFSLPFDIQRIFNLLSAEPKAPSYDIPITMDGVFDYHIKGDLSEYEWLAGIVRWVLYIVFIIGLIMITNKLIGRG